MFVASYRNTEAGVRNKHIAAQQRAAKEAIDAGMVKMRRRVQEREARAAEITMLVNREALAVAAIEEAKAKIAELQVKRRHGRHSYREIELRALKLFRIKRAELMSNRRRKDVVFARQFIMYWAYRLTCRSLPEIGRLMGNRDHTTVLHGARCYPDKRAEMGRTLRAVTHNAMRGLPSRDAALSE